MPTIQYTKDVIAGFVDPRDGKKQVFFRFPIQIVWPTPPPDLKEKNRIVDAAAANVARNARDFAKQFVSLHPGFADVGTFAFGDDSTMRDPVVTP